MVTLVFAGEIPVQKTFLEGCPNAANVSGSQCNAESLLASMEPRYVNMFKFLSFALPHKKCVREQGCSLL